MKNVIVKTEKASTNKRGKKSGFKSAKLSADYEVVGRLDEALAEVRGQAYAVQAVKEYLFGINNRTNARGVGGLLTFIGPPAVGKTLVGEKIAEALRRPCLRLDMGGFNDPEIGLCELFGVQKSYKAASSGLLTSYVKEHPVCVVLLDEFEKAHANVKGRFLQIFDCGDAFDLYEERNISFRDVIVVVTMNLGSSIYNKSLTTYNLSTVPQKTIVRAMKTEINPQLSAPYLSEALVSRLAQGRIILFNRLRPEIIRRIIIRELCVQGHYYREQYGVTFAANAGNLAELLLFGLGENADVRSAIKATREFFEVNFERLVKRSCSKGGNAFNNVEIDVNFDDLPAETDELFFGKNERRILICCSKAYRKKFTDAVGERAEVIFANGSDADSVADSDISAAILDINEEERQYCGRLFEKLVGFDEIPVYVYNTKDGGSVELQRYMDKGATDGYSGKTFPDGWLDDVLNGIYLSAITRSLYRAGKVVKFKTDYCFKDESTAIIGINDVTVATAKDAEDMDRFVSARQMPNVRLDDVYGATEAKKEIYGITEILRNFKKWRRLGLRLPRGILFHGEPGTGKTMLAKALAGEAGMEFIQCNAAEFMQKYVGEGARLIRETFATARRYAPSIVFIDEVDTIAKSRLNADNEICTEVLNTLLSELDGFADNSSTPVFVVAATNFSPEKGETLLDPAFLRRFDRHIKIELPDLDTRERYISDAMKKYPASVTERAVANIASRSIGWSLAKLDAVIQNALRNALCGGKTEEITDKDLNEAFEIYENGESKSCGQDEMYGTAVHEAGHAVIAAKLGIMPSYATIVSRGDYGGYVYYGDEKITKLSRKDSLNRICLMMAGRAAETAVFGEEGITSGISGDLKSATGLAVNMICEYGMEENFLVYTDPANRAENAVVNGRAAEIISEQYERAKKLIAENLEKVKEVANALLDKVSLDETDLRELLEKPMEAEYEHENATRGVQSNAR